MIPVMHVPPPPVSLPLASLAARLAELRAALVAAAESARDEATESGAREALKAEIIALFRQVDAAVQEAQALKAGVKALASEWKHLRSAADGGAADPDTPDAGTTERRAAVAATVTGGSSGRVDHLGASTFIEKGWSRLSIGDAEGAEVALHKALALAPDSNDAETLLGWTQMLQGQFEEALLRCQTVLRREPQHAMARTNVGYICLRQGRWDEAIEHLSTVIGADRDRKATLYAHLYLGLLYHDRERFDDAEASFRRALELGPNLLQAWYELGRSYWYAGRRTDALLAWRTGAEANKFSPWGKRCAEIISVVEQGGAPARVD
jgi:tetratricopeptide (TPR) repeat protein